jgi:predicted DNA-binding transcriptional regulator AlpA
MTERLTLLTVKDLAQILNVNERTCWRLARLAEDGHGMFPKPLRIGPKTVRWRLVDVEAYLAHMAGESEPKYSSRMCHN